jgi:hypothetical protein
MMTHCVFAWYSYSFVKVDVRLLLRVGIPFVLAWLCLFAEVPHFEDSVVVVDSCEVAAAWGLFYFFALYEISFTATNAFLECEFIRLQIILLDPVLPVVLLGNRYCPSRV